MIAKVITASIVGIEGVLIDVEVDAANRGLPTFTIVGLPSKSVDEAKERVRSALVNSGFTLPDSRLTVNLAPADIPKDGSHFDAPIAIGLLAAQGIIPADVLHEVLILGELSLHGGLRQTNGVLPMVLGAKQKGIRTAFIPKANILEVSRVSDMTIYAVETLSDIALHLIGTQLQEALSPHITTLEEGVWDFDMAHVKGQEVAKRALTIAAAGMHNIHMKGVPGAGKTMLSRAFPSILPPMTEEEEEEVTKIYSVAGLLGGAHYVTRRPFRSPHHTTSRNGLIGGGTKPTPGEITLAHRGVLFLDEFPEFQRSHLEALRQPLEDGHVTISRAAGSLTFPARFLLLAASNPCPCGYLGHPKKRCTCSPSAIIKYQKRLSGPILDRIDLHIHIEPVEEEKLLSLPTGESSADIREKVTKAWELQRKRFMGKNLKSNSEMKSGDIETYCTIDADAKAIMQTATQKLALSARSFMKVLKVAQTITDLEGKHSIDRSTIAEALQYRPRSE